MNILLAQTKKPEDFGFRRFKTTFKKDTVDILIKSKKGEEQKKKPLFLFCQGSLPQPLIKLYDSDKIYSVFAFNTDSLEIYYHLAIISKPFIPILVDEKQLSKNFIFVDSTTGKPPLAYAKRNFLNYYADRNLEVINYLQKMPFINNSKLVIAGHSEGSTIASKIASKSKKVTHLIYASCDPLGRILSMINQNRFNESDTDSTKYADYTFEYWKSVVSDSDNLDSEGGNTNKATYTFSNPPIKYLMKLKIPVLICFGTKDWCASANDYLQIETIRQKKTNFTFIPYIGLEHNFFPLNKEGLPNYNEFNWDKVALDWGNWLKVNF